MKATGLEAPRLRPLPAPFQCITTMRGSLTLPWATPSSAPNPRRVISRGPSTSTFNPSSVSFLQRSASPGWFMLGGSLTRSRVRNTPFATPFSGSHRRFRSRWFGVSSVSLASFGLSRLLLARAFLSNRMHAGPHQTPPRPICSGFSARSPPAADASRGIVAARGHGRRPPVQHARGEFAGLPRPMATTRDNPAPGAKMVQILPGALEFPAVGRQRPCNRPPVASSTCCHAGRHLAFAHEQHESAGPWQGRLGERDVEHGDETP